PRRRAASSDRGPRARAQLQVMRGRQARNCCRRLPAVRRFSLHVRRKAEERHHWARDESRRAARTRALAHAPGHDQNPSASLYPSPTCAALMQHAEETPLVKPLEGLRVVSLEQAVAAPMASRRLADAVARVIKLERPAGDFARG